MLFSYFAWLSATLIKKKVVVLSLSKDDHFFQQASYLKTLPTPIY
jgi:hypothetical protein